MEAVLYVRISELTDATTSPERQLAECRAYADRMGWRVVGEHEDLDISGTKRLEDRAGLTSALATIEAGRARYLVAYRIDRIARSIITFHEVVSRAEVAGGSVVSVSEGLDFSTPAGRMVASTLASFAQYESELIGQRVSSAKKYLAEAGKWPGGRRPFGWEPVPHESGKGFVLAPHPTESPILREMADRALAGETLVGIAGDLNKRGVSTALGKDWVAETVRKALTKKAMTGRDGAAPLLTASEYARLQHVIRRGAPAFRPLGHPDALLGPNLLVCGKCGSAMSPGTRSGGTRIYRCKSRAAPGRNGCTLTVVAEHVDAFVESEALAKLGRFPIEVAPEPEWVDPSAEERAEIEAALGSLEEDRYVRGLFSGVEGAERFERLYRGLEERLQALPGPVLAHDEDPVAIPTGKDFAQAWADASTETRTSWLASFVDSIQIAPSKGGRRFDTSRIAITWRF